MNKKIKNRFAIFASGNGSNALNLLSYTSRYLENSKVVCLLSDNPEAPIISKIKNDFSHVPVFVIPLKKSLNEKYSVAKKRQEMAILEKLKSLSVNWISLAGYMKILSEDFISLFHQEVCGISYDKKTLNRIINIHPSLLPKFPGKDAYRQAFESNEKSSGVTVHFVDGGVDTGQIIVQEKFQRKENDTLDKFTQRGLQTEYELYPKVFQMIDENKLGNNL